MLRTRVIPSLLIKDAGLVKTVGFKAPRYVGDPINAIKIFNDKEVDELAVLDISATKRGSIDFELLSRMNKEAFMPLGYGGGIKNVDDIQRILALGYEKVIVNSSAIDDPGLIERAAKACGSQSVVVCVDVKKDLLGYRLYDHRKGKALRRDALEWAQECVRRGAGEVILYSVDRDGTMSGYDLAFLSAAASRMDVPLVALGGAGKLEDFRLATEAGASAVAAGSIFVFYGARRAVLITYPEKAILRKLFEKAEKAC